MSLPVTVTPETRGIRPGCKFEGHTGRVTGIIHLPGGQRMMTCSWDGSLRIWDLQSGTQIVNDWRDGKSDVNTIVLSLDGKKVASGSDDGAVRLWDVDTGKVIAKLAGDQNPILSVCWNRDGGRVVSGSDGDGTARVWGVESGKTVLAIETGFSSMGSVIYSPDTTMIATGEYRKEGEEYVKIWDAKTGKLIANLKGDTRPVNCLAWTADGKTLISGSDDSSIRTWNTTTWLQTAVLTGHTDPVYGIAISPNGRILASTSSYGGSLVTVRFAALPPTIFKVRLGIRNVLTITLFFLRDVVTQSLSKRFSAVPAHCRNIRARCEQQGAQV
jgi:WD40 repeat protein